MQWLSRPSTAMRPTADFMATRNAPATSAVPSGHRRGHARNVLMLLPGAFDAMTATATMPRLFTTQEIADLVADDVNNIYRFIREDRIPYAVGPDGFLIPLGGFQMCMTDLYPEMMEL